MITGLRNFVICEIEKDDEKGTVYSDEIMKLTGARSISIEPQLSEGTLYGDDQILESESSVTAINVSINLANLTLEEEAFVTGAKLENGVLKNSKDDTPPNLALGFMAPKSKTSGGGYRMVWLLKGTAKPLSEEMKTKEDNIEYQTPTIDYLFTPRLSDGQFRYKADTNSETGIDVEKFFTSEFLKEGTIIA